MARKRYRKPEGGHGVIAGYLPLAVIVPAVIGAVGVGSVMAGMYDSLVFALEWSFEVPLDEVLTLFFG